MSHQGKPSTSTTSDAAQFVSRGGKGGRGRGGGGGRGQSSNKQQQQQKTRQNTPGGGSGAQQGNKATRPPAGAAPAGTPAAAQNGASERKDGAAAAPKQTQSYVPKAAPATAVPPSAAASPAGVQQLPVPTAATSAQQPTHQQAAAPAADGNGTTGAAALQAPAPHAPQPRPPVTATGGQGPAPPYVGYTNGAGAPPPGGRGRGIPPRTQSAPPNLKEQKQSPIFIPTRATPNAGAFPAAPYYPPSGPYYPPPPGVQPGVSPSHPYAPPGQGVPPPRGGPNLYQPPAHGRAQGPPGAGAHGVGPQGGPPPSMGGPLPQGVGAPQMPPQQPMGPTTYVPPHRIPTFVPGRAAPFIPRGHAGLQPIPPPHSMPMQIPQKRRTNRIAIIDPKTGKEVGNSPPKDESPLNDTASPYQQSPPGAGLRIPHGGGGIMSHPYAPAGTSPSRQAPHFKPDDFADGGPVEQFAPNHPYAPGRSAAIPIEKPPSAAVVISKPPAPAETASSATTPSPTTTATTPTEQPSGSAPQEAAQEAAAAPATTEAASAQEPTTKPAEADKKEAEVPPPEKQAPEEQQKQEEEPPKQPEESKAETPAPQAAEAQPKPEPTVEERKPEEVKAEETAPEAAKQLEEAKQVEQVPAVDATKDESSEKAPEAQPAEPAAAPEPTPAPATEKPTDEAEPGKVEQKPAAEESGKKASESRAGKAKPTRKGSVKKSDEGDAKPSEATEKKASEDADKKPTEEPHKPKEEEQPPAKPAEAEQDDDDWEVKAEKEDLVLQKDISLRPSYTGSSGAQAPFRSTLTPQAGDASWSGSGSKRTYDRDFLLKFQTFCRERPDGLPPVEVILGNDDRGKSGGGAGGGARGGKGGRGGGMNSSGEWSRGQQQFANRGRGGPGMFAPAPGKFNAPPGLSAPMARGPGAAARGAPQGGPMRRVPKKGMPGREAPPGIMPPPEPVAPMVDNPSVWKPSRRRGDDNEEIYGKVRSILNKLTSDKFGPLSAQMVELLKSKATTVEILREIINIIFDKALAEPGFSTMYAELCRVLEKNCPTFETNKEGKPQTFKRILLNRCQEAFEHKPQEEQPTEDPLKKEEIEVKQKRRMIGNIVFIGELYKEHMLTDKIMHECVFRRLLGEMKNPAEADLEALCKLMNTIGKVLDVPKAKNYMEAYFKRMKTLSQNPNIPSRIRFLLLDVLDLRANKWVSSVTEKPKQGGRGGAQPKSAGPSAPAAAGGPGGRGGGGSGAYRPGGPGSGPQGGRANQDGWETVGRGGHSRGDRSERGGDRGGSSGSERGPPVTLSSGEVVLGPNQSRMGTIMGGTGAKGWRDASNKARPQDSRRDAASSRPGAAPAPAPKGNIFAALSDMPERSPQAESRQSARPTSVRDRSRSREDREAPAPSPRGDARKEAAAPSPRSAEKEAEVGPLDPEIEKSIKLLLEEFLDTQDEEEARQCVDDIEGSGFQPHLVKAIIVMATEKKEEVREMLLQLITHFHKKATITPAHFTAGLRLVLEQLDDIRLDAPMAPKVVGQFIGSALLDEYLSASFVLPALEPLVESGSALSVLVGLFNFYVENTSIGDTREFVKEAGWDVNSMFKKSKRDPASVTDWIQVNGLDRVFPVAWAQGRLKALLESGDDAGKILKWMEENVARDVWDDEEFVQRLTGVFVEFVGARTKALSDAQAVAEEETKLFEQYAPFLKQFTADSPQTQQACLAAVQRYCFGLNFPDGLLERLFQNLLDNELVDDEAFSTWAADTQDSFGKSQALAQVSGWLSGAQKEDDGEGAP